MMDVVGHKWRHKVLSLTAGLLRTPCRPEGLLIKYPQFLDVLNALNVQPHNIFKECHPRCVYQNDNGLIINNGSQKHNYICKYNNLPTTCFGLIRPSSGWKYSVRGNLSV